ncbi:MAG: M20 family metallopeptidase [Candidatus Thorarchaeota archaeon]|nr:M20 family metallopeptidase [Candidatus Thorarchaeota archaeon]
MDESRVLTLVKELVATNSENPQGITEEVATVLRDHMESHGIACTPVGLTERPNLIFSSHDGQTGDILMHGHIDTVPIGLPESWSHDPFSSEIVDGLLYGRGSCDMKGPVAALAETLILYTEERHTKPLVVLATSDEETGCHGAEVVAKSGKLDGIKFGVCAEPTNLQVLVGEKGIFWSKIVATGKSAHGSRPEEGLNAIQACMDAIRLITEEPFPFEADELLGTPTMNVGVIEGGMKVNIVPDTCEAQLDMRLVKGQDPDALLKAMNARLESAGLSDRVQAEYIHGKPAVLTPVDSEIVTLARTVVERVTGKSPTLSTATYGTDCSVLQPDVGILNVICGPGSIEQAHQPDEFIFLDELYQSVDVYLEIARNFSN